MKTKKSVIKENLITEINFKQNRLKLGLSQAELAEKLGCSRVQISRIETGAREPSRRLLKAFNMLLELNKKK